MRRIANPREVGSSSSRMDDVAMIQACMAIILAKVASHGIRILSGGRMPNTSFQIRSSRLCSTNAHRVSYNPAKKYKTSSSPSPPSLVSIYTPTTKGIELQTLTRVALAESSAMDDGMGDMGHGMAPMGDMGQGMGDMGHEMSHMGHGMGNMHMTFFWGKNAQILFSGWPGNRGGMYALALIVVFVLAVLIEWFSYSRVISPRWSRVVAGLVQTAMHAVRVGLMYVVMLAVMSFNVGVLIAAILGHAVGFLLFYSSVFNRTPVPDKESKGYLPPMAC